MNTLCKAFITLVIILPVYSQFDMRVIYHDFNSSHHDFAGDSDLPQQVCEAAETKDIPILVDTLDAGRKPLENPLNNCDKNPVNAISPEEWFDDE